MINKHDYNHQNQLFFLIYNKMLSKGLILYRMIKINYKIMIYISNVYIIFNSKNISYNFINLI